MYHSLLVNLKKWSNKQARSMYTSDSSLHLSRARARSHTQTNSQTHMDWMELTWLIGLGEKMMNQKKKKKRRKEELLEEEEEVYDVLPKDIWIEILLRLPFLTLVGARVVCRAWNDIIARWQSHQHRSRIPTALLGFSRVHDHNQHPCTLHDCSLPHNCKIVPPPFLNLLFPIASCHGLVCFTILAYLDLVFVGNPLLNEDLLMIRGSNTNLKTAVVETENRRNQTWDTYVSRYFVGFGFSPKINSYKIMQSMHLFKGPRQQPSFIVGAFEICTICNSSGEHEEPPSWRSLGSFPPQFSNKTTEKNPVGSYFKGGIHWLFCDETDDSIFISRLDLDTEEFGRVEVPQASNFKTNAKLNFDGMCLGVSDGYLNICANLFSEECDIWVMKEYDSWTKQFVVRSPVAVVPPRPNSCVQVLNYAAAKASTRGAAVFEVLLLYNHSSLFACATKGGHIREVELPWRPFYFFAHIPSFISIKDVAKM